MRVTEAVDSTVPTATVERLMVLAVVTIGVAGVIPIVAIVVRAWLADGLRRDQGNRYPGRDR